MQFLGQAPVRLPDVVGRGGARDPQDFVWVFHCPSAETYVADRRTANLAPTSLFRAWKN